MTEKKTDQSLIALLKTSFGTLFASPLVFYPYFLVAFVHLLVMEILYFSPRFPLATFFGPIVRKLWGEVYMHYPYNLILLPKMFQFAQVFIYIFVSSLLICASIAILNAINNDRKITFGAAVRSLIPQYVYIVFAAILIFFSFKGIFSLYDLLVQRAALIHSTTGFFFILKKAILWAVPYVNLLVGVIVGTIYAYVYPLLVIGRKKIWTALILNFKYLWRSFFFIFGIVLLPTIFYLPILVLRNSVSLVTDEIMPELRIVFITLSIITMVTVDAVVFTAITTHYLLRQEDQ